MNADEVAERDLACSGSLNRATFYLAEAARRARPDVLRLHLERVGEVLERALGFAAEVATQSGAAAFARGVAADEAEQAQRDRAELLDAARPEANAALHIDHETRSA